jgi:uncharacterized DUF497 family protein
VGQYYIGANTFSVTLQHDGQVIAILLRLTLGRSLTVGLKSPNESTSWIGILPLGLSPERRYNSDKSCTNTINAYTIIRMELEFDLAKDAANIAKHDISLADSLLVYEAPNKRTLQTERSNESRLLDIAMVEIAGIVLVLVYVIRGNVVRAISLRRASKAERRLYEQAQQN